MPIVRKSESIPHRNSDACVVHEYNSATPDIDGAIINLSGRYPSKGFTRNLGATALIYMIRGDGFVTLNNVDTPVSEGDQIIIPSGVVYALSGILQALYVSTPAWSPDQAEQVD